MPPLWEQRAKLIEENTDLLVEWLSLLAPKGQRNVLRSMVRRFTLPQLSLSNEHMKGEIELAKRSLAKKIREEG